MSVTRSIILADDHALVRAGIRSLIEKLDGVTVVAEAGDGLEVIQLVREWHPDLLVLDITLPGLNGLELAERLSKRFPGIKILMLSMHAGAEYVARAFAAGAAGYLVKDSAFEELESALNALFAGRRYLSRRLDRDVVERFEHQLEQGASELDILTPRQRQILQLIAEGHSTREIAEQLNLSVKTIEAHRAQLMDRLGIHDVAGLVRFAIRVRLVTPDT